MKRKIFLITLFILISRNIFSLDDVLFRGNGNSILLNEDMVIIYEYNLEERKYSEINRKYEIVYDNKIPFLKFDNNKNDKWLFLHSDYFSIVFKDSNQNFFSGIGYINKLNNIRNAVYNSTSFLIDGDTKYQASNLGLNNPDTPWVEGVPGNGIGEKINLFWQTWKERDGTDGGIGCLIICNGYISYDKPYLYEKNNRVRDIRIKDLKGKFNFTIELLDTPNPQLVFLPYVSEHMEIEILSVYEGTTWKDTCIQSIDGLEMNQALTLKDTIELNNTQK